MTRPIALLCSLFAELLLVVALIPKAVDAELTMKPTDDSYVSSLESSLHSNYGGSNILYSYYHKYLVGVTTYVQQYQTWVKFDLSGIPPEAKVDSIILRMHTFVVISVNTVAVFLSDTNNWTEEEITWTNAPMVPDANLSGTTSVVESDTDYSFELSSVPKERAVISLVIKTLEPTGLNQYASFYSKEGGHSPELAVKYTIPPDFLDVTPATYAVLLGFLTILLTAVIITIARTKKEQAEKTAHLESRSSEQENQKKRGIGKRRRQ